MLVIGEGKNPGLAQLQTLAKQHGIKNGPPAKKQAQLFKRWHPGDFALIQKHC
jgi:hypothetical protein